MESAPSLPTNMQTMSTTLPVGETRDVVSPSESPVVVTAEIVSKSSRSNVSLAVPDSVMSRMVMATAASERKPQTGTRTPSRMRMPVKLLRLRSLLIEKRYDYEDKRYRSS